MTVVPPTRRGRELAGVCLLAAALAFTPEYGSAAPLPIDSVRPASAPSTLHLTTEASWVGDAIGVVSGDAFSGPAFLNVASLSVLLESAPTRHGSVAAHFQVLGIAGSELSARVGDVQGISNIEAGSSWRPYQAFLEYRAPGGGVGLLLGLFDLNSEFYVTEAAAAFLNPSHGIGPEMALTGAGGPSIFPATAVAVRLRWRLREDLTWRVAAFDAVPGSAGRPAVTGVSLSRDEGALLVTEVAHATGSFLAGGGGLRLAAGTWAYTARASALLHGDRTLRNGGAYLLLEAASETCTGESASWCVRAFLRGGAAEPRVNAVRQGWGAGMTLSRSEGGPLWGIALARAVSSAAERSLVDLDGARPSTGETNLELTLRVSPAPWLVLQPDVQFVLDPGMDSRRAPIVAAGLRIHLLP